MSGTRSFKVTLGVMPNYTPTEAGLKIDGVSDGKPAQKAGLVGGDVIIQLGSYPIKDIEAYMDALAKFDKGETISVKVKRNGAVVDLKVTF
jgi:S1-C subfamily serine protease